MVVMRPEVFLWFPSRPMGFIELDYFDLLHMTTAFEPHTLLVQASPMVRGLLPASHLPSLPTHLAYSFPTLDMDSTAPTTGPW